MIAIHKTLSESGESILMQLTRTVQILTPPYYGMKFKTIAAPAQYGYNFNKYKFVIGKLELATPLGGCSPLENKEDYVGKIVIVKRGQCMFQEKSRNAQKVGAIGVIVIDNVIGSSHETTLPFAMAGDNAQEDDIVIPTVLLYDIEAQELLKSFQKDPNIIVRIGESFANPLHIFKQNLLGLIKN